jgi:predicted enzyme related to lactoylglutathione lyase
MARLVAPPTVRQGGVICPRTHPRRSRVRWSSSSRRVTLFTVPLRPHHIVFDAHDLPALARFWAEVLNWKILSERENEIVVGPDVTSPIGLCFMPVTDEKAVKNRVHLDLTTNADDRDAEIARVLSLGAREVDIGQTGFESWRVLADPEGNEFCVVRPKATLIE